MGGRLGDVKIAISTINNNQDAREEHNYDDLRHLWSGNLDCHSATKNEIHLSSSTIKDDFVRKFF